MLNFNAAVPAHHPLRASKRQIDAVLRKLSPLLDEVYEERGRPSSAPEQRLKVCVWRALASVRSERVFCEPLG